MKNIVTRNTKAIFDLSMHNGVDIGVGRDMFAFNLSLYPTHGVIHPGADVDYKALSDEWQKMTTGERTEALEAYSNLMKKHYHELGDAYREKDFEKFEEIVENA